MTTIVLAIFVILAFVILIVRRWLILRRLSRGPVDAWQMKAVMERDGHLSIDPHSALALLERGGQFCGYGWSGTETYTAPPEWRAAIAQARRDGIID